MKRKFYKNEVIHIYQRSISGFNLFYTNEDFIVFYTIASIQAKRIGINMLGLCLMIDHIHILLTTDSLKNMSRFLSACTSTYVREFNTETGRKGSLFKSSYGNSIKSEVKQIRSAIAYLFNNPVEKRLCIRAEDYKWNFLEYCRPGYAIKQSRCSRRLKRSMKIVQDSVNCGRYLKYNLQKKLFENLDAEERKMLTDYILVAYLPFNASGLTGYYKSYAEMLIAINSNTGSEYDISEKHYCKTDAPYREIILYLKDIGIKDIKTLIVMPKEEKMQYMILLKAKTSASKIQIKKFLHLGEE